jgi:hypothetical protein
MQNNLKVNASPNVVTVGNYHCDFVTIADALSSITDASASKPYVLSLETQSYAQIGGYVFNKEFVNIDGEFAEFRTRVALSKNSFFHMGACFDISGVPPALYFNTGLPTDEAYANVENISIQNGGESGVACEGGKLVLRANKVGVDTAAAAGIVMCYGFPGFSEGTTIASTNFIEPSSAAAAHSYGFYHDGGTHYHNFNVVSSAGTSNSNTGYAGLMGEGVPQKSYLFGNYLGGKQSFNLTGGTNVIMTNACVSEGGVASVISAGTENYLIANRFEGDLTLASGATLHGIVNSPSGNLNISDLRQFRGIWGDRMYGYNFFEMSGDNPFWLMYNDNVSYDQKVLRLTVQHAGLPGTSYTNRPAAHIYIANTEASPTELLPGLCITNGTDGMIFGVDPSGNTFSPGNTYSAINAYYSGGFKVGVTGYAHVTKHDWTNNNLQHYISTSNVADSALVQYQNVTVSNSKVSIAHKALYNLDSLSGRVGIGYDTPVSIGVKGFWGLILVVIESTATTPLYRGVGLMSGYPAETITSISADLITNFTITSGQDTAGKINIYVDDDTHLITVKNKLPSATLYIRASCILGHPFQF